MKVQSNFSPQKKLRKRTLFFRGFVAFLAMLIAIAIPITTATESGSAETGITASAANTSSYIYYSKYTGSSKSIVDALKSIGVDSSFSTRNAIAKTNGISSYSGTSSQNTTLLNLLKKGKLVKWEFKSETGVSVTKGSSVSMTLKFRGIGISNLRVSTSNSSIATAKYTSTWKSAGEWCTVNATVTGQAVGSCTVTFTLGKNGTTLSRKIAVNTKAATTTKKTTTTTKASSTTILSGNLSKVKFIKQGTSTCKATSLAMSLNLILGKNTYTTSSLGGSSCTNINGKTYTGSNNIVYKATYKGDSYVGSKTELTNAINAAINAKVPIVVAVHSTKSSGTKHHWVIVVGGSSSNYTIIDPCYGTNGKLLSASTTTMNARSYALGLTDYSSTHYGYITFTKK